MTQQETFEKVVNHLLTQGVLATEDGTNKTRCMYRGHNGTKCAIGCLITDEEYKPSMEGLGITEIRGKYIFPTSITKHSGHFLSVLQSLHDNHSSFSLDNKEWLTNVEYTAKDFNLNCDFLATR